MKSRLRAHLLQGSASTQSQCCNDVCKQLSLQPRTHSRTRLQPISEQLHRFQASLQHWLCVNVGAWCKRALGQTLYSIRTNFNKKENYSVSSWVLIVLQFVFGSFQNGFCTRLSLEALRLVADLLNGVLETLRPVTDQFEFKFRNTEAGSWSAWVWVRRHWGL